jgi:hypothetical protein
MKRACPFVVIVALLIVPAVAQEPVNADNYERVIESDVKASATVIAATLYQLAMRDEMLPRFSKADMPAPPAPRTTTSAQ